MLTGDAAASPRALLAMRPHALRPLLLGVALSAGACSRDEVPDAAERFPQIWQVAASGVQPVPVAPCGPTSTAARGPLTTTFAGVGIPLPAEVREVALHEQPGEDHREHRLWQWQKPPAAAAAFRYDVLRAGARSVTPSDTLAAEAGEVSLCSLRIDGRPARLLAYTLRPGGRNALSASPVVMLRLWAELDAARLLALEWSGADATRDEAMRVLRGVRLGLTPSAAEVPHLAPDPYPDVNPDSIAAGDSATFVGRSAFAMLSDSVFSPWSLARYRTRRADVLHLEHGVGEALQVVASLVLPGPPESIDVYTHDLDGEMCLLDGVMDPEIIGGYADRSDDAPLPAHPVLAWRASRERRRFEPVDPLRVRCMESDGGD